MTVICMSRQEIDRVSVLRDLDQRCITVAQAATRMHLTRRPGSRGLLQSLKMAVEWAGRSRTSRRPYEGSPA